MDDYEGKAKHNLAETCCASISLKDLIDLSQETKPDIVDISRKLTYGDIRGSPNLRANLAKLYTTQGSSTLDPDHILITPGAIQANFLALYSLVNPGDHVICQYPTYQQLYSVPKSFGAEVSLWRSDPARDWSLDLEALKSMIKSNTKLIIIK
jgi:aspartate/methionine/tyrosine aminotransferase